MKKALKRIGAQAFLQLKMALKRIGVILMWFALMAFALLVLVVFVPPAFVVGIISKLWRSHIGKAMDEYAKDLRNVDVALDILGNLTVFNWLWFLFKKKDGYRFGNPGDTVSYVLWKNVESGTLTGFGKFWVKVILRLDKKHFDVFIKENI